MEFGFIIWDLGFKIWNLGFKIWDLKIWKLEVRIRNLLWNSSFEVRVREKDGVQLKAFGQITPGSRLGGAAVSGTSSEAVSPYPPYGDLARVSPPGWQYI